MKKISFKGFVLIPKNTPLVIPLATWAFGDFGINDLIKSHLESALDIIKIDITVLTENGEIFMYFLSTVCQFSTVVSEILWNKTQSAVRKITSYYFMNFNYSVVDLKSYKFAFNGSKLYKFSMNKITLFSFKISWAYLRWATD